MILQSKGLMAAALLFLCMPVGWAQSTGGAAQAPASAPASAPPAATDEDNGPAQDNGVIVIPKKTQPDEPPPPPAPEQPVIKSLPEQGSYTVRVDSSVVNVDVSVLLDKDKQFVPNLTAANFRVWEDGDLQTVQSVKVTQTPVTAVMLLEFAANSWAFVNDMRNSADEFFRTLRPDDYIAVMTYAMRTEILTDFTSDHRVVEDALNSLTMPGFRDTNLFDALYETLDRLARVDGKKDIILIGSGRDTFSKINLDQMLAKIKATPNVTIYTVSTGQLARELTEDTGRMGPITTMDYLQADNEMKTFAQMTGGQSFFPLFEGGLPDVFKAIDQQMRSEYVVSYKPTNTALDGTYRKLHVELVDEEGHTLQMQDEKGRPLKYSIIARDGYTARRAVE